MDIQLGDIARMRKAHPCGSADWEVIRVGADIKIKCLGCGRIVMLERPAFEKRLKKITARGSEAEGKNGKKEEDGAV
ncbi:MAG: DUF951 domain-containing protein [Eubacteriales bacterium]|nr:DUF951 domain-containing protein [Eubacteriales bacterium]